MGGHAVYSIAPRSYTGSSLRLAIAIVNKTGKLQANFKRDWCERHHLFGDSYYGS
jgi:hypothetical protein